MKRKKSSKRYFLISLAMLLLLGMAYLRYYKLRHENLQLTDSDFTFGIDISHYQGTIDWEEMKETHHPIEFVIVRSTMGIDGQDKTFETNFKQAKKSGYLTGAYHYYRPNEDATKQFENFSNTVNLDSGDLLPILDIEALGDSSLEYLRTGLNTWLELAEEEFGSKPIIYTGRTFYSNYLKGHIDDYPLWVASFSGKHMLNNIDWVMHQFTDEVRIKGINHKVDGNDFNGTIDELKAAHTINKTPPPLLQ
jgi:lysozyme